MDGVIPLRMEGVSFDVDAIKLFIADFDRLLIQPCVEFATYCQTFRGSRRRDQFDNRETATQGFSTPVLTDVAKQTMLNLVPLGGARRIMADGHRQARLIGKILQFT